MMKLVKTKQITNERGNAMIETLPVLVIFIVLLSFGLGLFGIVHTGIMNSMSARAYAFETFSNRSDTTLFRDRIVDGLYYKFDTIGNRIHTTDSEKKVTENLPNNAQYATSRPLGFGRSPSGGTSQNGPSGGNAVQNHNTRIYEITGRNGQGGVEVSPAWVMVSYGLCNDAQCGDR